jgi:hypothetical protein
VIVNVHHFADLVIEFLRSNQNFGMRVEISREDVLLDTGGGLKKAAWFFLEDGDDQPFLLHNVDVISNIDVERMLRAHEAAQALATLAVQERPTSRYLLFDEKSQLCGRRTAATGDERVLTCGWPARERTLAPSAPTNTIGGTWELQGASRPQRKRWAFRVDRTKCGCLMRHIRPELARKSPE